MRVLSYRGPSAPGGVSNTLTQIFEQHLNCGDWWYVCDDRLLCKSNMSDETSYPLGNTLRRQHYAYCNNFLWPVLHDLPQFAHYSHEERQCYRAFNSSVAFRLRCAERGSNDGCFVNDYQFALVPSLLKHSIDSFVFWHIPWPKKVLPEHVLAISELALGLLHSNVVGFHTQEYAENFFRFVEHHLPQFEVHTRQHSIDCNKLVKGTSHRTRFLVAPLGLDSKRWSDLGRLGPLRLPNPPVQGLPFILSVDRADYTKGIRERFAAIECFFDCYPEWRRKVTFLQLGTRSRQGLPHFDKYWHDCRQSYGALNAARAGDNWQPVVWGESPRSALELACLYSRAAVMLVSPLRDGLNLTAKEYVACLRFRQGVLALSQGAGAWTELGEDCVDIDPGDPVSFAGAIAECLNMNEAEKLQRSRSLLDSLSGNSLSSWWQSFHQFCRPTESKQLLQKVCS